MQKATYLYFLLLFFFSFIISSCENKSVTVTKVADVRSYIYAYTSGTISRTSPVRVRFTRDVIGEEEVGSLVADQIFRLQPDLEGTAAWEDTRTLVFEPGTAFESGEEYLAAVSLNSLFANVPQEVEDFQFPFRTRDLRYDVTIDGLRAKSSENLKDQELYGIVHTADLADSDLVMKALTATQEGNPLKVRWDHQEGNTRHAFYVEGISRGAGPSEVELSWNASSLGIPSSGEEKVSVPAINEFKVTSVKVQQGRDAAVVLSFSDPLQKSQELKGLVSISNYSGQLRYIVDGNQLSVFPAGRIFGERKVTVQPEIKNIKGTKMQRVSDWKILLRDTKPQIKLVGQGTIMPNSNGLVFPFEAVSLSAVDFEVLKIFDNNILQFLQTNTLDGGYDLERVGRIILQEKVVLKDLDPTANLYEWSRFAVDLGKLINDDPYAIYQVRIGFRPDYALYNCGETNETTTEELTFMTNPLNEEGTFTSIWGDYYGINGYYDDYQWEHRQDPCYGAYYNYDRFVKRNVLASDIGLIAKSGKDGSVMVAVTDIKSTNSLGEVELNFYDYQQQLIKSMQTDGEGMVHTTLDREPFAVIASSGNQRGYLRLLDPNALAMSRFDVSGATPQKGLKGFIYGERGVWRPGDSIFLNFVLEDKQGKLPADHPINFELIDSRGQVQQSWTTSENINSVFSLKTVTDATAPTGNWMAKVKVGGAAFSKRIRVETVKPNRLKIDLDFGKEKFAARDRDLSGRLQVNWLHGAPAGDVAVRIEKQIFPINTTFSDYNEYEFDDPARDFSAEPMVVFEDKVNDQGSAQVNIRRDRKKPFPGKCRTRFNIRAFEKGGDFSTDQFSVEESFFDTYTGIFIKKNKYDEKRLDIGKKNTIEFVAVDEAGNPQSGRNLQIGLYRINWRWWWDRGSDNISQYNSARHFGSIDLASVQTNGKGEADWNVTIQDWGRYLVRVCDSQSGHCSGDIFYAGYPWDDGDNAQNRQAAAMLAFSADKKKYEVGETVELTIPSSGACKALISLENGSRVIESYWTETQNGETKFSFYATEEMTPTVYANVSLLQPHAQAQNDLPIRLYGVIPIGVESKDTRLNPALKMPETLEPETEVTLQVAEENGKPMAYTIAMVDEGLLDLTRFQTPDPWNSFFAREALGVKTWDLYDHVLGAYGGSLERILAIGGDAALKRSGENSNANRFQPMVIHLGPYYLDPGKTARHQIKVPNYIGSVRTMVVASGQGAYGSAEKTTPVRKPIMVLATLPRVLGPTESLSMPVTVFAMEPGIKNVKVDVRETSGLVKLVNGAAQNLSFSKPGESLLNFDLEIGDRIGIAKFIITAEGGGKKASQEIEIAIRNPNPIVTNVAEKVIQPGEEWRFAYEAVGMPGTNEGLLEVSNIPPIDLGKRLNYLVRYPHGCIEQTISAGFPQLFVSKLMEVDEERKQQISDNIVATLGRLKQFQLANGGFGYWPGDNYASTWGTNYGGHFMLEAQKLGYSIPAGVLNKWKAYQKRQARNWNLGDNRYDNDLTQAYRLYTLALAGAPEAGAMNRMREQENVSDQAKWRLAAAYAQTGRAEVAAAMVKALDTVIEDYRELSYTYGSGLRDEAMILETLVIMNDLDRAGKTAKRISEQLSSGQWMGTQTVGYSLLAIAKFVGNTSVGDQFGFAYQIGQQAAVNAGSTTPVMHIEIPIDGNNDRSLSLKNDSKGLLYVSMITSGQPLVGDQSIRENDLKLNVVYKDMEGELLEPSRLTQGTDFIAEVTVTNPGTRGIRYEEMALTQIFPSGWEIINSRMNNIQRFADSRKPEYQDIKDDRVYTYFDINRRESHTYRIQLNASYAGKYYLPTLSCDAMYDETISARKPGQWVSVIPAESL